MLNRINALLFIFGLAGLLTALSIPQICASEKTEIEARMAEDVTRLLDQLLGAGKAKIFIIVEGEENVVNTQTEVTTPLGGAATAGMPGYQSSKYLEKTYQQLAQKKDSMFMQREQEQSARTLGFKISRVNVSLVLDKAITEAQSNAVRLVISDLLRLDSRRGDNLVIIRAEMIAPWKSAIYSPEGYRTIFFAAGLAVVLLFIFFMAYFLISKTTKGIVEFATMRRAKQEAASESTMQQFGQIANVGMKMPGEAPQLLDLDAAPERPGAIAQSGRALESKSQFGYLEELPPKELQQLLEPEHIEDLAFLIAHLTDKSPHLASKVLLLYTLDVRNEISKAILDIKQADPERIYDIENRLRTRVDMTMKGADKLGKLLSIMDPNDRLNILGNLSISNPESSAQIEQSLITFEDLCRIQTETLRQIVNTVNYEEWGVALRGFPQEETTHVLEIFPDEIRPIVQDIISSPQKKDRIMSARSIIVNAAVSLAAKGKISLGQGVASSDMI